MKLKNIAIRQNSRSIGSLKQEMNTRRLEPHYKPSEAAEILGVTTETLRRYEKLGMLKCKRLPSGRIRIPKSEVERLLSYPPRWRLKAKRQK
jgi:DNA-directed RNA polymerase specialized sigma24 family protein